MIEYSDLSLFQEDGTHYINPVNLVGVMGAGIAKEFAIRYPRMVRIYQDLCAEGMLREGVILCYALSESRIIVNLPTKRDWRNPASLELTRRGLRALAQEVQGYEQSGVTARVVMPKIGCGLGGLRWHTQVEPVVSETLSEVSVVVCTKRIETTHEIHVPLIELTHEITAPSFEWWITKDV